jgi:hypothetical protein
MRAVGHSAVPAHAAVPAMCGITLAKTRATGPAAAKAAADVLVGSSLPAVAVAAAAATADVTGRPAAARLAEGKACYCQLLPQATTRQTPGHAACNARHGQHQHQQGS